MVRYAVILSRADRVWGPLAGSAPQTSIHYCATSYSMVTTCAIGEILCIGSELNLLELAAKKQWGGQRAGVMQFQNHEGKAAKQRQPKITMGIKKTLHWEQLIQSQYLSGGSEKSDDLCIFPSPSNLWDIKYVSTLEKCNWSHNHTCYKKSFFFNFMENGFLTTLDSVFCQSWAVVWLCCCGIFEAR